MASRFPLPRDFKCICLSTESLPRMQFGLCAHLCDGPVGPLRIVLQHSHQDVGVHQQALSKALRSGSAPRFDTVSRVCAALGVRLVVQPLHPA